MTALLDDDVVTLDLDYESAMYVGSRIGFEVYEGGAYRIIAGTETEADEIAAFEARDDIARRRRHPRKELNP